MLTIIKPFTGTTVKDTSSGDSNRFLGNILVEVTAENYKQMMHEAIFLKDAGVTDLTGILDPPLRANERILSGLFGNAISMIAERSRPEVRIDRGEIAEERYEELKNDIEDDQGDEPDGGRNRAGRIDYLAWYAKRTFAIELKAAFMNCESNLLTAKIKKRWGVVVEQAAMAQTWLRKRNKEDSIRYPNPVSISLMAVIAKRAVNVKKVKELDKGVESYGKDFLGALSKLVPKPQFQALYTFPAEFRCLAPRKHGKPVDGNMIYTPFVAFIARSNVNSQIN